MVVQSSHFALRKCVSFLFLCFAIFALPACWSSKSIVSAPKKKTEEDKEMRIRRDISGYAQNFIGTNYKSAGNSPRSGFDCSGFTCYVMKEFEVDLERTSSGQSQMGKRVKVADAQPGDLVYFAKGGRVFHVSLVVANSSEGIEVVHATSSRGVVRENISTSSYWKPKIKGVRNVLSM